MKCVSLISYNNANNLMNLYRVQVNAENYFLHEFVQMYIVKIFLRPYVTASKTASPAMPLNLCKQRTDLGIYQQFKTKLLKVQRNNLQGARW